MKDIIQLWRFLKPYRAWIGVVILVLAMAYTFWNRRSKPTPSVSPTPQSSPTLATTPTSTPRSTATPAATPGGQSSILYSQPVTSVSYDAKSGLFYFYDISSSLLVRYNPKTQEKTELSEPLDYAERAVWAPNHEQAILFLVNGQGNRVANPFYQEDVADGETVVGLYDLKGRQFTKLNHKITDAIFADDQKIIYEYDDGTTHSLAMADANGENWRTLKNLSQSVAFARSGKTVLVQEGTGQRIARYDTSGKTLTDLTVPSDLQLEQSAWSDSGSALYLTGSSLKIFRNGIGDALTKIESAQQPAILWDNGSKRIYVVTDTALTQLATESP